MRYKALLLAPILLTASVCSASRVSGTYVGHGAAFAEMLQLTETGNGQVNGVLTGVELRSDGSIKSEQAPVTGSVDADQLTLNIRAGLLSFLVGTSVSGTVSENTITLQTVDAGGNVASHVFVRGTTADFKAYADQLKSKGVGIEFSAKLLSNAKVFRETVANAENWIKGAELHAQRIPAIRARYQEIESKMQSLVATERNTSDPAARGQVGVAVNQGSVAGSQLDIEVDQLWDLDIGRDGSALNTDFSKWDGKCSEPAELQKRGASVESADTWVNACKAALAEREKFTPIFKHIMEQRAEVKTIEAAAQARRKALVAESDRIE